MNNRGKVFFKSLCDQNVSVDIIHQLLFADDTEFGYIFMYLCDKRHDMYYQFIDYDVFLKAVKARINAEVNPNIAPFLSPNMYMTLSEFKRCVHILDEMYPPLQK